MSSGEADRIVVKTLDGKRRCAVDGCPWEVIGADRCQEHGGDPLGAVRTDEWGEDTEMYAAPALKAAWRLWASEE